MFKLLKKTLLLLGGLLALSIPAAAQGYHYRDIAYVNAGGQVQVLGGASITVCQPGATGIPCSPTQPIYSDVGLSVPITNLHADGNGNFDFYITPGDDYVFTIVSLNGSISHSYKFSAPCTIASSCAGGVSSVNTLSGAVTLAAGTDITITPSGNTLTFASTSANILPLNNTFLGTNYFAGPAPFIDVHAFGYSEAGNLSTTCSIMSGSHTMTIGADPGFVNGNGIVCWGAGATETMVVPSGLTVTPGISQTLMVPDADLTTTTGSTTWKYKVLGRDKFGGLTVPTTATTITNGLATLGLQHLAVTSLTLTGNTLTVVLTAPSSLSTGDLVHIQDYQNAPESIPAQLEGWLQVSSTSGAGQTLVFTHITVYSDTTITASPSHATVTYAAGNKLSWTGNTSVDEYVVCRSGPSDSGAYHFIGLTRPTGNLDVGGYEYADFGEAAPGVPAYINDGDCTAGSPTNDYLVSTITAGAGGTTLTLVDTASNTVSGATALLTNGPALLAAANSQYNGNVVVTNSNPGGEIGYINNYTDLSGAQSGSISLRQEAGMRINETFVPPHKWTGWNTNGATLEFADTASVTIGCGTAWPCVRIPNTQVNISDLTILSGSGKDQSFLMEWFGADGSQFNNMGFSTGSSTEDYCGMGFLILSQAFHFSSTHMGFNNGPGNSYPFADTTWCPVFYMPHGDPNQGSDDNDFTLQASFKGRGGYIRGSTGLTSGTILDTYCQGCVSLPLWTLQGGIANIQFTGNQQNDTGPQPGAALLGNSNPSITFNNAEVGGFGGEPPLTGFAPESFQVTGAMFPNTIQFENAKRFDPRTYYAGDAFDLAMLPNVIGNARGILDLTVPVSTSSGAFIPLLTPIPATATVTAGGSTGVFAGLLVCVHAVGYSQGGYSADSCQRVATTMANQTVNLDWSAHPTPGAQSYQISAPEIGNVPFMVSGSTTTYSITTAFTGGGVIRNFDKAGGGSGGFDSIGLYSPQLLLWEKDESGNCLAGISLIWDAPATHRATVCNNNGTPSAIATLADISSASTWAGLTAGTNSNAGTFAASGNAWNFGSATHTRPTVITTSGALPGTCTTGELAFATDASAGQNLYECNSGTWTQQLNSGAGGASTALDNIAATALSASLIPGTSNTVALGSNTLAFTNLFVGTVTNVSGSFNTSNLTANRTMNIPDATSTLVRACTVTTHEFVTAIAVATGICSQAQPTLADIAAGASPSGLFDFTAATMELPEGAGFTANVDSTIGLDTTANTVHTWINSADALIAAFASAPAGSLCVQTSGTKGLLLEAAAVCGTTTPSSVDTFTHKTENVEATGNSLSLPVKAFFLAGGCNNSTAANSLDIGTTNTPTPQCVGSTVRKGVLQFARGNVAYINWHLPPDWNSSAATDIEIGFTTTDTTNGHITSFNIQTGCNKVDGTAADDPSLNALQALSVTTGASQVSGGELTGSKTSLTMTGCAADYNFEIAITRNNSGTDTNTDTAVAVKFAEVTTGVTKNAANR